MSNDVDEAFDEKKSIIKTDILRTYSFGGFEVVNLNMFSDVLEIAIERIIKE